MGWNPLGDGVWQLPFPILMFVLLATGVLVTSREHKNMTKQMEYWRDVATKAIDTTYTQADTIKEYAEAAKITAKAVTEVRKLAEQNVEGKNVSTT